MLITGIDPGLHGAFATLDTDTRKIVDVLDMPAWQQMVGRKKRTRIDAVEVADYFDTLKMMGVELVVIESVGGMPGQSASAGFVFGYTVGLIYMACMVSRIPIETIVPGTWKKHMRLPGKKVDGWEGAIIGRADELYPDSRDAWRGQRGGYKIDRAEAALLATFGADVLMRSTRPVTDVELRSVYRNADTGA